MAPRFHNTLTRRTEEFSPLRAGEVRLYTCGPTVYDFAHIGNFRTYLWEDLLRRYLKWLGFRVTQVMNLTDVDDKTIARAAAGRSLRDYTQTYIDAFFEDLDHLGIERAEHYPRATDHIPEMVALVLRLKANGHIYESRGSLYFKIDSFPGYGRLSGLDLSTLGQARIDSDEYDKDSPRDFAVWKARKEGEPCWETELGRGRPGWHLECSAMAMKPRDSDPHRGRTTSSRTMRTRSPRAKPRPAGRSCGPGCTRPTSSSTARRCRNRSATSTRSGTCGRRGTSRGRSAS
jgi:cysteinyl-tRNA synthetase